MKKLFLFLALFIIPFISYAADYEVTTAGNNVGLGSSNPGTTLDVQGTVRSIAMSMTGPHVTYVSCGSSISTAITNASAGDTLTLGSCTYLPTAAFSTFAKSISIVGQGRENTIINTGANSISTSLFNTTADGLKISHLTIRGAALASAVTVDLTAGTGTSGVNNVFTDLNLDLYSNRSTGFFLFDTGGTFVDDKIIVHGTDWSTSGQSYGIQNDTFSTMDVDSYLNIKNVYIENLSTDTVGAGGTEIRGIRFYNFLNGDDPNNKYLVADNLTIKVRDSSVPPNVIEALHMQGARIHAYIYNSSLDGYGSDPTVSVANTRKDYRCDDGAECHFYNTSFVGGFWQNQGGGVVYKEGILEGQGLLLSQGNQDSSATDGIDAKDMITAVGAVGGNATGTGSRTGGNGAGVTLTAGVGGSATAATTTATGGNGGIFTLTGGAGSDETISSSVTNIGGPGGSLVYSGGIGGAANSAGTTNTGGNGGNIYAFGGVGGTGTSTSGNNGNVYLAITNGGVARGRVSIASTSQTQALFNVTGSSQFNGNVGIGTYGNNVQLAVGGASSAVITAMGANAAIISPGQGAALALENTTSSSSSQGAFLNIYSNDNAALASGDRLGGVFFGGSDQANSVKTSGSIESLTSAAWSAVSVPADIKISTVPAASTVRLERLRIKSDGNVGIGTFDVRQMFEVNGTLNPFVVTSTTNVGIGLLNPGMALDVSGTVRSSSTFIATGIASDAGTTDATVCNDTTNHKFSSGSGTLGICLGTSTKDAKENIIPIDKGLSQVMSLAPVSFNYKPGWGFDTQKSYYGFIAEDVEKILPILVGHDVDGKVKSADYVGMIPIIIKAIQEQQKEIDELKNNSK